MIFRSSSAILIGIHEGFDSQLVLWQPLCKTDNFTSWLGDLWRKLGVKDIKYLNKTITTTSNDHDNKITHKRTNYTQTNKLPTNEQITHKWTNYTQMNKNTHKRTDNTQTRTNYTQTNKLHTNEQTTHKRTNHTQTNTNTHKRTQIHTNEHTRTRTRTGTNTHTTNKITNNNNNTHKHTKQHIYEAAIKFTIRCVCNKSYHFIKTLSATLTRIGATGISDR